MSLPLESFYKTQGFAIILYASTIHISLYTYLGDLMMHEFLDNKH